MVATLLAAGVVGVCVGSFLNVLVDRLPEGQDVIRGRSHCDHCKRNLTWYELIPVVSWCIQGQKSRCCHRSLSVQYPLMELATGIGFVIIFLSHSPLLILLSSLILFCSFLVVFVVDLKTERIPVEMLYSAAAGVVLRLYPVASVCIAGGRSACSQLLLFYGVPAVIGAGLFFFLWLFSKGKAMGDGDILLALLIGLVVGYPMLIVSYYAAFLTGAIAGVILILGHKKQLKSHIPFGPFLILGLGIALMYGQGIVDWWELLW